MAFLPPAIFEIKAVADKAIAEFKQVNNELGKMEGQAEKAGGSIGGMDKASRVATAGLLAMGAAFAGFAALGVKEAMDAEVIMTKLNSTLASQGLNTAKTREEIDKLASSMVQLGFDDEEAASSMQVLIQSTGDLTKSKELLAMSADLARAKSISLESASQMLVRANMGAGKVFKQFGIVLDSTLPKAEATSKAMAELKEKLSGQAEKAAKTFTVQLQILKEQFNNAAQAVGEKLLPYLKSLMDNLNKAIEFVKRNSTAFKIFAGVILTLTIALASYNATIKTIAIATKAWTVITTVQKTIMAMLTGQQLALNAAMTINPIGLIVAAVVLLIAGLVMLWNKSETFRKAVISMAKAALNGIASIIPIVVDAGLSLIQFFLNPLKLILTVLSKLPGVGKYAKTGLDLMSKGFEGAANFAETAATKARSLADGLDRFNKPIKIKLMQTTETDFGNKGGVGDKGLTPEQKAAAKAAKEAQKKANEDYMKIVKDFQDKISDAQSKFNEKMTKIDSDYAKDTAKLKTDAQEQIAKLNKDASEKKLKAELETNKKITEAQTRFNDEMGKLNAKKAEDLAKLAKDNQNKIASITQSGNDKLQSIIQQSVNRLRDAFAKGTEFKVTDLFKGLAESGSANAEGLLAAIKTKLTAAKQLAQNAAMLQAQGFSQTFIEEVVAAGPEVGNQLAESLKNATPETISELQATFADMENTQNSGLDALATEMNKGARLATTELNEAYKDAQKDLAFALADQAKQYSEAQAEINKTFNEATAEAERTRDSAIASLKSDLAQTIAEIDKDLQESIAEVNKHLQDALNEAFVAYQEAQSDARKELADTLAEIEKDMVEKLGSITDATKATTNAIKALATALNSAKTFTAPQVIVPAKSDSVASGTMNNPLIKSDAIIGAEYMAGNGGKSLVINAPVTNYNTTSPEDIGNTFVRIAKYGMAVNV
jgi:molecular chaperone GrpE (heat shock protein)